MPSVFAGAAAGALIAAVALSASLVAVHITVAERERQHAQDLQAYGRHVGRRVGARLADLVEASSTFAGAIQGSAATLPVAPASANSTVATAVLRDVFTAINASVPGLQLISMAPADVVTASFPHQINATPNSDRRTAFLTDVRRSGAPRMTPVTGTTDVHVLVPVFNDSLTCTGTAACTDPYYWGFVHIMFDGDVLIAGDVELRHERFAYRLAYSSSLREEVVNWFTSPGFGEHVTDVAEVRDVNFGATGTVLRVKVSDTAHTEAGEIRSRAYAAAVIGSLLFGFIVGVAATIAILLARRTKSGPTLSKRAPRKAPLAAVAAEIVGASDLWLSAPEEASALIRKFANLARAEAEAAGAYLAQPIGDSVLVVASTAEEALDFSQRLSRRLANEGATARIAAHWCKDAKVTAQALAQDEGLEAVAEYTGPDVELIVAMHGVCPRGAVTITASFRRAALSSGALKGSEVLPLGAAAPEGDDGPSYVGYVVVPASDAPQPSLDEADRRVWTLAPELMASIDALSTADSVLLRSRDRSSDGFQNLDEAPHGPVAHAQQPSGDQRRGQMRSATGRGLAAGRMELVNRLLSHTAFAHNEHAEWLPARACEASEVQRLHHALQDHITTPAEAQHYAALLTLATYCLQAVQFVMSPLPPPEQAAIVRRMQVAFGVPERHFAVRLAAQLAVIAFRAIPEPNTGVAAGDQNATLDTFRGIEQAPAQALAHPHM